MVTGLNYPASAAGPGSPLTLLASPDGGYSTEIQRSRAVHHNGYTYIGFVGSGGSIIVLSRNNATGAETLTGVHSDWATDTHNTPALLVEANTHKLWVAYCEHDGAEMYLRISATSLDTDPDLSDGFGSETGLHSQLGGFADHTYPVLLQLTSETNDPVYLMWREVGSSLFRLAMSKTTNLGVTWSSRVLVYVEDAASSATDPYWKIGSNGTDRFDVLVAENNELRHFYYDGAYRTSDGTDTTIAPDANGGLEASDCTLVLDDTDGTVDRALGVCFDGTNPAGLAWQDNGGTTRRLVSVRWRTGAWQADTIIEDVGGFVSGIPYVSNADMHESDPDLVIAPRKVGSRWEMFRYTSADDGGSWTAEQLTTGSAADNLNPGFVLDAASEVQAFWHYGSLFTSAHFTFGFRGVAA